MGRKPIGKKAMTAAERQRARRERLREVRKAAERHWTAQAQKLLDLFELANGGPAGTILELEKWVRTPRAQAVLSLHRDADGKLDPYKTVAMPGLVRRRRNLKKKSKAKPPAKKKKAGK